MYEIAWMVMILGSAVFGSFTMGYFHGKAVWKNRIDGDVDDFIGLRKQLDILITMYQQEEKDK